MVRLLSDSNKAERSGRLLIIKLIISTVDGVDDGESLGRNGSSGFLYMIIKFSGADLRRSELIDKENGFRFFAWQAPPVSHRLSVALELPWKLHLGTSNRHQRKS